MRRVLTVVLVIVIVGVVGYMVYLWGNARSALSDQALDTAVVEKGEIAATVSATGKVVPASELTLAFESGGELTEIAVEEGDQVEEGQTLAQLDTAELEQQVAQARAGLQGAEARLDQILEQLESESAKQEIIVAKANLEKARLALEQAQSNYDKISWLPQVSAMPQALALQQAYIDYDSAQASYNLATAGPSQAQIRAAQADVDQARANFNLASLRLEKATIVAPFPGVVTYVGAQEGELVNPGSTILRLMDPSSYYVVFSLDETDIVQVKQGQEVDIALDALPDWEIKGEVEHISPSTGEATSQVIVYPTTDETVVTYAVRANMAPTEAPFKVGMTAEVTIVTQRKEGVLILPNKALQFNRDTGHVYVERLEEHNNIATVEVETGLADDFNTEIVSGLKEGDVVVIPGSSALEREQRIMMFSSGGD